MAEALQKANAFPTEPAVLCLGYGSPIAYHAVANTGDYAGPGSSYAEKDVSAHGGRASRWITTLYTAGHLTFPCWFIPGAGEVPSHTNPTNGLKGIHERGDLRAWSLQYNDDAGTARFFNAYVAKLSEKSPVAGVLEAAVDLLIDGVISTGTVAGGPSTAVFAPPEA